MLVVETEDGALRALVLDVDRVVFGAPGDPRVGAANLGACCGRCGSCARSGAADGHRRRARELAVPRVEASDATRAATRSAALDRICIVMMSAVGDAVHVLPVINALKRHRPSSHITWVLQPGPATLVRGHPAVDDIVLFDRVEGTAGIPRRAAARSRRGASTS